MANLLRAAVRLVSSALTTLGVLVRRPADRRRILIVVAGALICVYSIGVLWHVLSAPDIGLHCPLGMEIRRVVDDFAPSGDRDGPRDNDTLVALCGQRVDWQHFLRRLGDLRNEPPQTIPPELIRPSLTATLRAATDDPDLQIVRLDGKTWVRVDFTRTSGDGSAATCWRLLGTPDVEVVLPSVLWFLLKVGLFVVGAIVFWKRPEDPSASQFFVLCLVTIGAFMGGYNWLFIATQPALLPVFMVCAVLLPAVSLHFYLLFPRPKEFMLRHRRRALTAIYGVPALFLAAMVVCYATTRIHYAPDRATSPSEAFGLDWLRTLVFIYFPVAALWFLASVVSLVHSLRNAADATERNQVKCILFGALAAMVPIGYSLYLTLFNRSAFGKGAATWPMFVASAIFTATFTISITRYRLMQLDQIISSGVGYFLISFLAGLLYYGLVFVGMVFVGRQVLPWPSPGQALWVCGTALVLLVVLDLARGRLRRALDRHFRREKHGLDRTLKQMSQAIGQLVDPPALARRLLHTSAELLGTPRGSVYLRQGSPPLYVLADSLGGPPPLTELAPGCPLIEAVQARGTLPARHTRLAADDPAQRQLRFLGGAVAQPLTQEGQLQALLVLGPREEGSYGPDDLNLLAAFAQVTVLALVSAEGHQTIDTLNRELQAKIDKIAEQQRRIVALQTQLTNQSVVNSPPSAAKEEAADPAADPPRTPGGILGGSPQVRQLLAQVRKVAASPSEVLIRGESGTGKELLARALHESGPRAGRPFVTVHCAALSPGLLESELFGHVKGAFTGAHRDKVGRFELANSGTLFLDEIGDIDLSVQTKLLRVLQEMTFERVGSSDPVQVDVRLIAATHQDLETLIHRGRFREDLYYRLNVISITVPPLRERVEDVPELVQHFLRLYGGRCGKAELGIDDDALVVLKSYHWPGNVRQLENVVERAVVFAEGPAVTVEDLPPELVDRAELPAPLPGPHLPSTVAEERTDRDRRERERLVRALAAAAGNKAEAARALGMARSTLVSRLKKHGLS
jgi:transcriptional regulator with GAF, ATPase, and Fis domain